MARKVERRWTMGRGERGSRITPSGARRIGRARSGPSQGFMGGAVPVWGRPPSFPRSDPPDSKQTRPQFLREAYLQDPHFFILLSAHADWPGGATPSAICESQSPRTKPMVPLRARRGLQSNSPRPKINFAIPIRHPNDSHPLSHHSSHGSSFRTRQ